MSVPFDAPNRIPDCPDHTKFGSDNYFASDGDTVWVSDFKSSRTLIKAHVSRSTHAKARRKRMIEYQRIRMQQNQQGGGGIFNHLSCQIPNFELFLLNYYIHSIIKQYPEDRFLRYERAAMQDWFPVAITNHGMRTGLLLCASQSLYVRTGASQYHQCALQYKATCLRILGDAIKTIVGTSDSPSASKVDDATISVALQLASDEFAAGDSAAWESHIGAVGEMVRINGGLDNIKGMNGFLRVMIQMLELKHQRRIILTARSDLSDVSSLYSLDYFFGNDLSR